MRAHAKKLQLQQTCVMDHITEIVNANLPEGTRPISSLTKPGEINRTAVAILAEKVPAEEVCAMIAEMMLATRPTKFGPVPDWRAREAAGKLWFAYQEGLPIQRVQTTTEQVGTNDGDLLMRVIASPALLSSIRNLLVQAERVKIEAEEEGNPKSPTEV